jgi:hypothetical protein
VFGRRRDARRRGFPAGGAGAEILQVVDWDIGARRDRRISRLTRELLFLFLAKKK